MDDTDKPSKTQRKQVMTELQALGARLVELNNEQIASIALPDFLHEAVMEARRIKGHESRRRQLQYIGKLMRAVDPAPIREKLARWDGRSSSNVALEHAILRWRERLLTDDTAFTDFARQHPGAEIRQFRNLARKANAERVAGKPPRSYRELFKLVRETLEGASRPQAEDQA